MTKAVIFIALSAIATASAVDVAQQGNRRLYIGTVTEWLQRVLVSEQGPMYSCAESLAYCAAGYTQGEHTFLKRKAEVMRELNHLNRQRKLTAAEETLRSTLDSMSSRSDHSKKYVAAVIRALLELFAHQKRHQYRMAKTFQMYYHQKDRKRRLTPDEEEAVHLIKAIIAHFESDTDSETTTSASDDATVRITTASHKLTHADGAFHEEAQRGHSHESVNAIEQVDQAEDRFATATAEHAIAFGQDKTHATAAYQAKEHNYHTGEHATLEEIEHLHQLKQAFAELESSSSAPHDISEIAEEAEEALIAMGERIKRNHKKYIAKQKFDEWRNDVVIV